MRLQHFFIHLLCLLVFPTTAFADVEFYTYGGFRPIVNAFTNIAVIFDSEDYLVFGFVVAIIGVTVGMLVKSGLAALGKATSKDALAILFLAMFGTALFGALFEPKTTVHIYDPTHNQYESVGDIPLALAFIASGTNLLERFATDTVGDGIGFGRTRHANGKSLELMFNVLGGDPVSHNIYISKSIERYFKGCVVPAAANSATFSGFNYNSVLNGTADIWAELARTRDSDQRFLWFNEANPGGIVMTCEEGYDNIRTALEADDTFRTFIENACSKSGYESSTVEGIADCRDIIEETIPLIFAGSVDTSPENISAMVTLANGLYMTLAETPGSAITNIGNMKQMSQGYGSTIIAEGWLPSMRSATLVIILSFTPLIILMIFTPFVFRALHMLSALFLFLTVWGASDAIIHVVIVDNVMSMLSEIKTYGGGLRSFLTAPSEIQKSIAMFGKMQSLGVMFAGLMTAFYFKFSGMQFANMGEKLANDIDSTGQQVGNEVINPINRMETMRQAASSAGHYNLMAQVGPELHGAAIGETAAWSESTNAYKLQKMGELGYSPQQAITTGAQIRGGDAAGSAIPRIQRAVTDQSNVLDTSFNLASTNQLTQDGQSAFNQNLLNRFEGNPIDQADNLSAIRGAPEAANLDVSKNPSDHRVRALANAAQAAGRADALLNRYDDKKSIMDAGNRAATTDLENNDANYQARNDVVVADNATSRDDVAYQTARGSTNSSLGSYQAQEYAVRIGAADSGVDAARESGVAAFRDSTAANRSIEAAAAQTGTGELDRAVKNRMYSDQNITAQAEKRAVNSEILEKSPLDVAFMEGSTTTMGVNPTDAENFNDVYPGLLKDGQTGVVTFSQAPGEDGHWKANTADFKTGNSYTYSGGAEKYSDAGNIIQTGSNDAIMELIRSPQSHQDQLNLATSIAGSYMVSKSDSDSESSDVKAGASVSANVSAEGKVPIGGPIGKLAQYLGSFERKNPSSDAKGPDSTTKSDKGSTDSGKPSNVPGVGVLARAEGSGGFSFSGSSEEKESVDVNVAQVYDQISSLKEVIDAGDPIAIKDAIDEFRGTHMDRISDDQRHQSEKERIHNVTRISDKINAEIQDAKDAFESKFDDWSNITDQQNVNR